MRGSDDGSWSTSDRPRLRCALASTVFNAAVAPPRGQKIVFNRIEEHAALRTMLRKYLRLSDDQFWKVLPQHAHNAPVKFLASIAQQSAVGSVSQQRVFKQSTPRQVAGHDGIAAQP